MDEEVMQADDEQQVPDEEVVEETPESSEPTAEDSLQELIAKVAELEKSTGRIRELDQVKSSIGRISALQRQVDKLTQNTSTFADPRVDSVEDLLASLIDDISDSLSDQTKNKIMSRQQQRQQAQMLEEIKKSLPQTAQAEEPEDAAGVDPLWGAATTELLNEAKRLGIDENDPRIGWVDSGDAERGVIAAMERVRANFQKIVEADKAPERVVARKAAAKQAPGSAGPTRSLEEIMADESLPFAERMQALTALTT